MFAPWQNEADTDRDSVLMAQPNRQLLFSNKRFQA
jgi:hypothetical protein